MDRLIQYLRTLRKIRAAHAPSKDISIGKMEIAVPRINPSTTCLKCLETGFTSLFYQAAPGLEACASNVSPILNMRVRRFHRLLPVLRL